ncbi:transposase [Calothrix sp. NIES-2100]|uniref:transposase n=1 Tax=Calothrix sp. NIES-2100 TaxID=1954172 RepID=UPI000B6179D4|nr:transposase [Calothrix sp. NIES-2100]
MYEFAQLSIQKGDRAFSLTPANVDDRKPVPDRTKDLIGKLFSDQEYISQNLVDVGFHYVQPNPILFG